MQEIYKRQNNILKRQDFVKIYKLGKYRLSGSKHQRIQLFGFKEFFLPNLNDLLQPKRKLIILRV